MDLQGLMRYRWLGRLLLLLLVTGAAVPLRAQATLDRVEYFFDSDNGVGAGTPVTLPTTASTTLSQLNFSVSMAAVSPGFHTLSVRSRAANGRWSQTYRQIFYKEAASTAAPPANLAAVEYFVDTDPGYGQGSSATITGGSTSAIGVSFTAGLGSLPAGFHTLYCRVRDAAGKWSQTQNRLFYVDETAVAAVPNLTKAEYYFDTDPGYGLGRDIPIATPAPTLTNLSLLADASDLLAGPHRLFVRVRAASGRWSQVLSRAFTKSGCASSPNYAADQPPASYGGSGISVAAAEQLFNGATVTASAGVFFNGYYAQVDLGATPRTVSQVQLSLQNVNSTAVNYGLQIESSTDLSTWAVVDSYAATLAASQAGPINLTRVLPTVQSNVRGLRLRLVLPAVSEGIRVTNAAVLFFSATCPIPVITSFTPTSGPAGTTVTVTGTGLDGATSVAFNGTPAGTITNNTAYSLTVSAPAGGTDGPICVTTAGGTACSGTSYFYPLSIATGPVASNQLCAGSPLTVPFSTTTAGYAPGNVFGFQLSDASGAFPANAPVLGTLQSSSATGGVLTGLIPSATPAGGGYRVRVVATSPAVTGTANGADLTITNLTPISAGSNSPVVAGSIISLTASNFNGATYSWTGPNGYAATGPNPSIVSATAASAGTYSVVVSLNGCTTTASTTVVVNAAGPVASLQTAALAGSYCAGTPISVPFTASNFTTGNVFTAQLSDASGSFASPVSIGALVGTDAGTIVGLLPATMVAGAGYRIRVVGSQPATVGADNGNNLIITAAGVFTWLGSTSTSWLEASNWSCGQVPDSTSTVLVPAGLSRYPVLGTGLFQVTHLTVASGASLTLTGTLSLKGNLTNNGTFSSAAGSLVCGGPGTQVLSGNALRFLNLTLRNSSGVTLQAPLGLRQMLYLALGSLASNGLLTLESDAAGTALVVNAGGAVTGTATVQRYLDPSLNPGLGYRHYSSPVQSTTVGDLTTTGFSPVVNADYNTMGNTVTPFPTVYSFDESRITAASATTQAFEQGYFSPTSLSSPLVVGRGYTVNLAASEKVDLVGTLNTGTVPVGALSRGSQAESGWHLLGNPYPAPLDWNVARQNLPTGMNDAVYVYKSSTQYDGTYQVYQNGLGTLPDGLIGSMQGFFVRVSQPVAAFSFLNAWRATSYQNPTVNRPAAGRRPTLQLDLVSAQGVHDPAFVYFEDGATAGLDDHYDAEKLPNTTGLNLASVAAGTGLAINGLPRMNTATTVPLTVHVPTTGTYSLRAASIANLATTDVYLHDALTHQQINLKQQPTYTFTVSTAALLTGRFTLTFGPLRPTATKNGFSAASVSLYPNPVHKSFTVLVPAVSGESQAQLTLYNVLGQPVHTAQLPLPAAGAQTRVDVQTLPLGVYVLRVKVGASTIIKQVVVN